MALLWTCAEDVTSRWVGGSIPATDSQIETLLADAEDTVLSEFPDLPDRLDAGLIPLTRVQKVVARVVIRHLRNPSGIRQEQEGAGPYQQTRTYSGDQPGSLFLTDADRAELGGSKDGAAFTIDAMPEPVHGHWETPNSWRPTP